MNFRKYFICSLIVLSACSKSDWRTADRSSAGIAPLPDEEPGALVQIYAARAFKWRGAFAVHCWLATKEPGAKAYTVYHVIGWRLLRDQSAVVIEEDLPDRHWYNAKPEVIYELKGEKAETAIPKIIAAARAYPYPKTYRAWPGPNSNTFVSYILRQVPELGVELPPHAIGKDWLENGDFFSKSETGTGFQFSFFGILGLTVGLSDGVEFNFLGLNFGLDFLRPALKLPFIGRVGLKDEPL